MINVRQTFVSPIKNRIIITLTHRWTRFCSRVVSRLNSLFKAPVFATYELCPSLREQLGSIDRYVKSSPPLMVLRLFYIVRVSRSFRWLKINSVHQQRRAKMLLIYFYGIAFFLFYIYASLERQTLHVVRLLNAPFDPNPNSHGPHSGVSIKV